MKRFAAKLLCMLLALALTLALWVAAILALPDRMQGTIAATMHTKADLLQDTAGQPRIIFAGGSSSPYGTVCRMVEEELGCTAINVGATAYLGLEFYLQLLEQHACEGDVIVLAPERTMLAENGTDYTLVWQAAGNDPDVWAAVPLSYLPGLFCASDDYYRLRRGASDAQADVTYHPDFGPLGDVTLQRETLLASGWDTQDPVRLEAGGWSMDKVRRINRFAAKMQARGVSVFFAFAPLDAACIQTDEAQIAAYADGLTAALEIPVIVTQQQAILPAEYFYDSNNHLTSAGAAVNTRNLIDGLRARWAPG